jgi:hypothetical protein
VIFGVHGVDGLLLDWLMITVLAVAAVIAICITIGFWMARR